SLHNRREERGARRHLVRQPLSRMRRRHAEPLLFLLLRAAKRLDALFLSARGTARLPEESRDRISHPQSPAPQYTTDVVTLGREQAALDLDPEDERRRRNIRIDRARQRDWAAQRSVPRPFQG